MRRVWPTIPTRVLSDVQLPGDIVDHYTTQQGVHIGEIDMYCRHGDLSQANLELGLIHKSIAAVLCYLFVRYLSYSGCTRHMDAADVHRVIIRILQLIAISSRLCNCSIYLAYHERTVGFSSSLNSHSSSERPRSYRLCRQISWRGLV